MRGGVRGGGYYQPVVGCSEELINNVKRAIDYFFLDNSDKRVNHEVCRSAQEFIERVLIAIEQQLKNDESYPGEWKTLRGYKKTISAILDPSNAPSLAAYQRLLFSTPASSPSPASTRPSNSTPFLAAAVSECSPDSQRIELQEAKKLLRDAREAKRRVENKSGVSDPVKMAVLAKEAIERTQKKIEALRQEQTNLAPLVRAETSSGVEERPMLKKLEILEVKLQTEQIMLDIAKLRGEQAPSGIGPCL